MTSIGKLALTAAVSALVSAGSVAVLTAKPLRLARLEVPHLGPGGQTPAGAVRKASDGHFWAWAEANGAPIRCLVDTGATTVALTLKDAETLGFRVADLRFTSEVTTAGGASRAAPVTLASVAVGGARVEDVAAVVVEDGLDVSLLGMSYLGRLSRFEGVGETMILKR